MMKRGSGPQPGPSFRRWVVALSNWHRFQLRGQMALPSDRNASSTLANWTLASFDFAKDCERSVKFFNPLNEASLSIPDHYLALDPFPYGELIDLARAVAPTPFRNISGGAIVDWVDGLNFTAENTTTALDWIFFNCTVTFCRSQGWQGNPDLVGIGVFLSYIIEVALATCFFLAESVGRLVRRRQTNAANPSHGARLRTALRSSFGFFWNTAVMFHISVTTATIVSTLQDTSAYNRYLARASMCITLFIPILTWPFQASNNRKPRRSFATHWYWYITIGAVFFLTWAILVVMHVRVAEGDKGVFETACFRPPIGVPDPGVESWTLTILDACIVFTGLYETAWLSEWSKRKFRRLPPGLRTDASVRRGKIVALTIWGGLFAFLIYTSLVNIALIRISTSELAGPSWQENKWGFGQVVAVTAWLPTIFDFALVYFSELLFVLLFLGRGLTTCASG